MTHALFRLAAALLLAFPVVADAATPENRAALIIGNGAYQRVPVLPNPANDARAMAETLTGLGFDVVTLVDGDRNNMVRALGEFRRKMKTDGVGLFYYAGHGIQVRGRNYLIPIEAEIAEENDTPLVAIDLETIQNEMENAGVRLSLFILDACRDNPFEKRFRSAGSRGLAPVDAARGTLIAFATAPGKTAADGTADHGLFTGELLKAMVKPGLNLENVLKATAEGVERESGNQQTPWYNSAFHGEFYFTGPVNVTVTAPPGAPSGAEQRELLFWESIKSSREPADFEDFLKRYPQSEFAPLAQRRRDALKAAAVALPPPLPKPPPAAPAPTAVPPPPPANIAPPAKTPVPSPYREIHRALQPEARDASGRITTESSEIHVLACDGPGGNRTQIYVYKYLTRTAFRAIAPPNWGAPLGGRDFKSFEEAARAGCGMPAAAR